MVNDDKAEKDRGTEDSQADSETDKKSERKDDDEGELTPVKPKAGEPTGNLRRRAEWFRKRH